MRLVFDQILTKCLFARTAIQFRILVPKIFIMSASEWTEVHLPSRNVIRPRLKQKDNSLEEIRKFAVKEGLGSCITLRSEDKADMDKGLKDLLDENKDCLMIGKLIPEVFEIDVPAKDNFKYDAVIITKSRAPFVLTVAENEKEGLISHNQELNNKVRRGLISFTKRNITTVGGVLLASDIQTKEELNNFMGTCENEMLGKTNEDKLYMDEHKRVDVIKALVTRLAFRKLVNNTSFCMTLDEYKHAYDITHL